MAVDLEKLQSLLDRHSDAMLPALQKVRKHIHENPELSWEEIETQAFLKDWMEQQGMAPQVTAGTGLFVDIGESEHPVIYRCDIDALPIDSSDIDRPINSKVPGVSHSCGHDVHATIGAGVASVLHAMRKELPGRVRVVFQPAEEVVPSGGEAVLEAGVLDGMRAAVGIHVDPSIEVGSIGVLEGCLTANSDKFVIEIEGKSGHAARPHLAKDALLAGAKIVQASTGLVRDHVNPLESAVVTVGLFQAGEADNVVAGHAHLAGSIRTFSPEVRALVEDELRRMSNLIAEVHNCTASLEIKTGAPCIVNDGRLHKIVKSVGAGFLGEKNVQALPHPSSGSEDFGLFGRRGPIYMLRFGVRTPGDSVAHLHTPQFFSDERSVDLGVKLMGRVVLRTLVDTGL